ncbi:MAG: NYN domain-containing protein, partial [Clostridiales bacterium]|nr:NYN domain-containing protein [Clostridiales bacterium]
DNPTASIFCSHGAGFLVKWDEVEDYMHLNNEWTKEKDKELNVKIVEQQTKQVKKSSYRGTLEEDKELESIFTRTYGPIERKLHTSRNMFGYENDGYGKRKSKGHKKSKSSDLDNYNADQQNKWDLKKKRDHRKNFLLVDGYNIIFAWDELKDLANANLAAARLKLADILSNYQGYRKNTIILVFDAYKVEGGKGESMDYKNIHVVFTKEAETADMYIEKVTRDIAKKHNVVVATSDRVEQMIILGQGAMRLSADELLEEVEFVRQEIRTNYLNKAPKKMNSIGEQFADELDKFTRDE